MSLLPSDLNDFFSKFKTKSKFLPLSSLFFKNSLLLLLILAIYDPNNLSYVLILIGIFFGA